MSIVLLKFVVKTTILRWCKHPSQKICKTISDMTKRLAAFDFDSTIVTDNSDIIVRNLLPKDVVINYEKRTGGFSSEGWTSYMQGIFELLHNENINKHTITRSVTQIPPIEGMCQLIKELTYLNFDVIIISDANSYFISQWLEEHKLLNLIKNIFTNPGEFVNDLLTIRMYHVQDSCSLSTINLCKGQILDDFIKSQKETGVTYNQIIYIGDGVNDFCPILRLNLGDLAFCRVGFKCAKIVQDVKDGKTYQNQHYNIKSDVSLWKNGFDILHVVEDSLKTNF